MFVVSPKLEFCYSRKDRQVMSNAIVAKQLLAVKATNNY